MLRSFLRRRDAEPCGGPQLREQLVHRLHEQAPLLAQLLLREPCELLFELLVCGLFFVRALADQQEQFLCVVRIDFSEVSLLARCQFASAFHAERQVFPCLVKAHFAGRDECRTFQRARPFRMPVAGNQPVERVCRLRDEACQQQCVDDIEQGVEQREGHRL